MTFANNKLWINNEDVQTILDNDDTYWMTSSESLAEIAILKKDDKIVHSAERNKDGTYDSNAGVLTTNRNTSLSEAARGTTSITPVGDINNGFKGNVNFYFKGAKDKILNTKLGTVVNGVRTITKPNEIKIVLSQLQN